MNNQLQVHSRPLRIAAIASQSLNAGGGNVYENAIARRFLKWCELRKVEAQLFARDGAGFLSEETDAEKRVDSYAVSALEKISAVARPLSATALLSRLAGPASLSARLRRSRPDIVYFLSPNPLAATLGDTAFVLTHWDLGHRELPFLPELAHNLEWEKREVIAQKTYPRAFHTFTESMASAKLLREIYGVSPSRVSSLGMGLASEPLKKVFPPLVDGDYVVYPAAKWPHKNHATLFRAFSEVLSNQPDVKLVLTGGDKGNEGFLRELSASLNLADSLIDLGRVGSEVLANIICHSRALVMPTILGPTNIPPLEALKSGVPVIASSIHRFDESYGDVITYVDPFDVQAWAEAISRACTQTPPSQESVQIRDIDIEREWDAVFENFVRYRNLWR